LEVNEADSKMDSVRQARQTSAISLGMACLVMNMLVLLYCAEYILIWLPKFDDFFRTLKVFIHPMTEFVVKWGWLLWCLCASCTVLSCVEVWRHPGRSRTIVVQAVACGTAVFLAILVRYAACWTFLGLFQGIGTKS